MLTFSDAMPREVAIDTAEGDLYLAIPFVHEGWVYYSCAHQPPDHRDGLYRKRSPGP